MLPKVILIIDAGMFLFFGVWFLCAGSAPIEGLGATVTGGAFITDIRATYGGFEIGFAAFLLSCLASRQSTALGLIAGACTIGGFAFGRLVGIIVDQPEGMLMQVFFVIELVACGLNVIAWRTLAHSRHGSQ